MGSGFRSIAWLLLLAFTLQSFITQTHIHGAFGGCAQTVKALESVPGHRTGAPIENKAGCSFCQAIAHAGVFFTPVEAMLSLHVTWAEMLLPALIPGAIDNFSSRPWHSRAPPLH